MYSRKKIEDGFSNLKKKDGKPMSRQQIHMLRKKANGICLTCGEKAIGVYCLKHTVVARERMRKVIGAKKRRKCSMSYQMEIENKLKTKHENKTTNPA